MKPVIFSSYPVSEEASEFFVVKSREPYLNDCIAWSTEISAPFTIICDIKSIDINYVLENIISTISYNPDIILMDIDDFKYTVQLDRKTFWIDNFKKSKLYVINNSLYKSILSKGEIAWEKPEIISKLTTKKFVCFPLFISDSSVSQKLEMYNTKNIQFKNI